MIKISARFPRSSIDEELKLMTLETHVSFLVKRVLNFLFTLRQEYLIQLRQYTAGGKEQLVLGSYIEKATKEMEKCSLEPIMIIVSDNFMP